MKDILCGKRGTHSFAETPLAKQAAGSNTYECPPGLFACENYQATEGTPYCLDAAKGEPCPITKLLIENKEAFD